MSSKIKSNKIKMNIEDAEKVMSEAYSDIQDIKAKANAFFSQVKRNITDASDVAVLGKNMSEMLRISIEASKMNITIAKLIVDYKKAPISINTNEAVLDENTLRALERISKKSNDLNLDI